MPARKPQSLNRRHNTKAENQARVSHEDALTPETGLPMAAPARLKGHAVASTAWRRMMRMYADLDAVVVTALDQDLLIDYCILLEQLGELDRMRSTTYTMWLELGLAHDQAIRKAKDADKAAKAAVKAANDAGAQMPAEGPGSLLAVEAWEEKAVALASKSLDAWEAVLKLDSRTDRKRDLLLKLRQSLYLTPRARAGAAPSKKEEELSLDPMDALLGQVNDFVNGDGK